jgi:hypothetical protein
MAEPSTIVVLGGPSAGKTVYLSVLYYHLWNGHDGMTMRAANGAMHSELLQSADALLKGTSPPATQALRHFEFELEHEHRPYYVRYLDYPGELYRKVFFDLTIDSKESNALMQMCENATGALVLVDPISAIENPAETDYMLSNMLRFFQTHMNRPKFTFAFTKRDENATQVGADLTSFVRLNLPHVAKQLGPGMRMMHFASIIRTPESILYAIEDEQSENERREFMRRLAARKAARSAVTVIAIGLALLSTFFVGALLRQLVETDVVTPTGSLP